MSLRTWSVVPLVSGVVACNAILGYGDFQKAETGEDAGGGGTSTPTSTPTTSPPPPTGTPDASSACTSAMPFGAPVALGASINTSAFEQSPTLTADELTIFFERSALDGSRGSVMQATRTSLGADFGTASEVTELGAGNSFTPTLSRDGRTLVFSSVNGSSDLAIATRATATGTFGGVRGLTVLNKSGAAEWMPSFGGANELFFVSTRSTSPLQGQLWHSTFDGTDFTAPTLVNELAGSIGGDVVAPSLTPDGLTLYFGTIKVPSDELDTIWKATRTSTTGAFASLVEVTELNDHSATNDPGWISPDNCRMYMVRARSGNGDIFVATRTR